MAILRAAPRCMYCKEIIAEEIHLDQSDIPTNQQLIGDTFIRWDYKEHECEEGKEYLRLIDKKI